jgi:hypothetical protein
MAAESMIRELFRNLETTLHERLGLIEQVLNTVEKPKVPLYDHEFVRRIERLEQFATLQQQQHVPSDVDERIRAIEEHLVSVYAELNVLKNTRTVTIAPAVHTATAHTAPAPATAHTAPVHTAPAPALFDPLEEEIEVEEEEEPIVEEEEGEELALEEFEYRGTTYWKDDDNNVYGADEDGEVNTDPIGTWNGKRILPLPH